MLIIWVPEDGGAAFWKLTRLPAGVITSGVAAIETGVVVVSEAASFLGRILPPVGDILPGRAAADGTGPRGPKERSGPACWG